MLTTAIGQAPQYTVHKARRAIAAIHLGQFNRFIDGDLRRDIRGIYQLKHADAEDISVKVVNRK